MDPGGLRLSEYRGCGRDDRRDDFKRSILQAFTEGIAPKSETTFGNVKADVLE